MSDASPLPTCIGGSVVARNSDSIVKKMLSTTSTTLHTDAKVGRPTDFSRQESIKTTATTTTATPLNTDGDPDDLTHAEEIMMKANVVSLSQITAYN